MDKSDEAKSRVQELVGALEEVGKVLLSEEYPCPGWNHTENKHCTNSVTLAWEHEYGEFGAVLSAWPIFTGCPLHATLLTETEIGGGAESQKRPGVEQEFTNDADVSWVLGMSRQRKDLRELLDKIYPQWKEASSLPENIGPTSPL